MPPKNTMPKTTLPTLATAEELATAFTMSTAQVWRLHRQGRIPSIYLGRRTLRFNLEAVAEALTAQSKPCTFLKGAQ
jgi:predicted DNA-binding transcriptional regulator AlpA